MIQDLACRCGCKVFSARVLGNEGVGLVTCEEGHHSLLFDSRDYWVECIQDGRPPARKCRCKSKLLALQAEYEFRESGDVRALCLRARCAACGSERVLMTADIKCGATDKVVQEPLDPIERPWLKPEWVTLTGLWTEEDLRRVLAYAEERLGATLFFDPIDGPVQALSAEEVVREAETGRAYWLWLGVGQVDFPTERMDCWRTTPVVDLRSPFTMSYQVGRGQLQYVRYAEEVAEGAEFVKQPGAFLSFARSLVEWLMSTFDSRRGRHTVDNPRERERLGFG